MSGPPAKVTKATQVEGPLPDLVMGPEEAVARQARETVPEPPSSSTPEQREEWFRVVNQSVDILFATGTPILFPVPVAGARGKDGTLNPARSMLCGGRWGIPRLGSVIMEIFPPGVDRKELLRKIAERPDAYQPQPIPSWKVFPEVDMTAAELRARVMELELQLDRTRVALERRETELAEREGPVLGGDGQEAMETEHSDTSISSGSDSPVTATGGVAVPSGSGQKATATKTATKLPSQTTPSSRAQPAVHLGASTSSCTHLGTVTLPSGAGFTARRVETAEGDVITYASVTAAGSIAEAGTLSSDRRLRSRKVADLAKGQHQSPAPSPRGSRASSTPGRKATRSAKAGTSSSSVTKKKKKEGGSPATAPAITLGVQSLALETSSPARGGGVITSGLDESSSEDETLAKVKRDAKPE